MRTTRNKDLDPTYFGSGALVRRAIARYGKENFQRNILEFANSKIDLQLLEEKYVNKEWIQRSDTYNMKLGGIGGFDHLLSNEEAQRKRITALKNSCQDRINTRVTRNCKHCSNTFSVRVASQRQFCSRLCANQRKIKPSNTACSTCHRSLYRQPNLLKLYSRFFCNKICAGRYKN